MTIKRPRGEIALQAETAILDAIGGAIMVAREAGEEKLADTMQAKRDGIANMWATRRRITAERQSTRAEQPAEQPQEQPAE